MTVKELESAIIVAADRYARMPCAENRNVVKDSVRDLSHHLAIQRDFTLDVAGRLNKWLRR
jgi:hypothetical protein